MDLNFEIYSQFTSKPLDMDQHRLLANNTLHSVDSRDTAEVLDSLKNNQFFSAETFDEFLARKNRGGKKTKFLKKEPEECLRDLKNEYRE